MIGTEKEKGEMNETIESIRAFLRADGLGGDLDVESGGAAILVSYREGDRVIRFRTEDLTVHTTDSSALDAWTAREIARIIRERIAAGTTDHVLDRVHRFDYSTLPPTSQVLRLVCGPGTGGQRIRNDKAKVL